jgi:hypothetical protein
VTQRCSGWKPAGQIMPEVRSEVAWSALISLLPDAFPDVVSWRSSVVDGFPAWSADRHPLS